MRVIVVGGAGFIGSNFVRILAANPENEILVLDKLTYAGNLANLFSDIESGSDTPRPTYKKDNITFFRVDISDVRVQLSEIFEKFRPDYVVNFAAESHVDNSINAAPLFLESNTSGVGNLLHHCNLYNKSHGLKKVVQISTDEVYGSLTREELPWTEGCLLYPRNHYSASKAAAEMVAMAYYETEGLPILLTRSSNNYGSHQHPEKLIPLFVTNLLIGKKVPVYGTGQNIRDWLHVDDNCDAIYALMLSGKAGEVYNIDGGNERTNLEITNLILDIMGYDRGSSIEFVEDRKGHDFRYSMNSDKIKKDLEWQPKIDFMKGLTDTIHWYRANGKWWKPLKLLD